MSSNKSFQSSMPSSSTNSIHDGGDSTATALPVIPSSLLMLPLQGNSSCGYSSIGNGLLPSLSSIAPYPQGDNDYDRHAILLETIEAVLEIVNEGDFPSFDDDSSNASPQYSTIHHYDQQQDSRGSRSSRSSNSNNSTASSEASGTASQ